MMGAVLRDALLCNAPQHEGAGDDPAIHRNKAAGESPPFFLDMIDLQPHLVVPAPVAGIHVLPSCCGK
jgi:hypothetical protein